MKKSQPFTFKCLLKMSFVWMGLINLSGCALYQSDFDCKYEKGVGCKSITEVNDLVDQGQFKDKTREGNGAKNLTLNSSKSPRIFQLQGEVQRLPEDWVKIWIAPHSDKQGNFHEGSHIHTVIRPGAWQVLESPSC